MATTINGLLAEFNKPYHLQRYNNIISLLEDGENVEFVIDELSDYFAEMLQLDLSEYMYVDGNSDITLFLEVLAAHASYCKTISKEMLVTAKTYPELKDVIATYHGEIVEVARILEDRLKFILNQMMRR